MTGYPLVFPCFFHRVIHNVSEVFLHLFVEVLAPEIFLGFSGCNATKQQQRYEVWNGHQRIHAVGNVPDNVETDNRAKEKGYDIENAIETVDATAFNVVDSTLAIIAPAKNGAEGERENAKG